MAKAKPASADSSKWPATRVEMRAIDSIRPYQFNPRTHSPEQVAQIAASMLEWGFTIPILVDEDGMIIAGHGRLQAAKLNGYTEVPVIIAEGWSDAQKQAYVIADNKLTENGGWDDDLLKMEVLKIQDAGFDLDLTGFDEKELKKLLNLEGEGDEGENGDILNSVFEIVVKCRDETHQLEVVEQLTGLGLDFKVLIA